MYFVLKWLEPWRWIEIKLDFRVHSQGDETGINRI